MFSTGEGGDTVRKLRMHIHYGQQFVFKITASLPIVVKKYRFNWKKK